MKNDSGFDKTIGNEYYEDFKSNRQKKNIKKLKKIRRETDHDKSNS